MRTLTCVALLGWKPKISYLLQMPRVNVQISTLPNPLPPPNVQWTLSGELVNMSTAPKINEIGIDIWVVTQLKQRVKFRSRNCIFAEFLVRRFKKAWCSWIKPIKETFFNEQVGQECFYYEEVTWVVSVYFQYRCFSIGLRIYLSCYLVVASRPDAE